MHIYQTITNSSSGISEGVVPSTVEGASLFLFPADSAVELDEDDSYLEDYGRDGGGLVDGLEYELSKPSMCQKTVAKFEGVDSGSLYLKFMDCYKWFSSCCGKRNGTIHQKRKAKIYENLSPMGGLSAVSLRQIVFTVPMEYREHFKSRKAIGSLYRMTKKIVESVFPDRPVVSYFHGFGDKDHAVFNPHWNFHVLEERGTFMVVDGAKLALLREKYKKALKGFGLRDIHTVDVHYSFAMDNKRVAHRIRYMSRPCPGYVNKSVLDDRELAELFVMEMKGFQYIRYCGDWELKQGVDDGPESKKELEKFAGERLRYVGRDRMTKTMFDMLYQPWEREMIAPGFYRIVPYVPRPPEYVDVPF